MFFAQFSYQQQNLVSYLIRRMLWFTLSRDCAHVLYNFKIAHTCYAIQRLPAQSQDSVTAQRNLEIAQIPRLHGTYVLVSAKYNFGSQEISLLM